MNDCHGREAGEPCVDSLLEGTTEEGWKRWIEDKKRQNERRWRRVVGRWSESTADRWQRLTAVLLSLTVSTEQHRCSSVNTEKHSQSRGRDVRSQSCERRCRFERPSRLKLEICCQRRHQCFPGGRSELNLTLWPSQIFHFRLLPQSHTQKRAHTLAVIKKKACPASKYVNWVTE